MQGPQLTAVAVAGEGTGLLRAAWVFCVPLPCAGLIRRRRLIKNCADK